MSAIRAMIERVAEHRVRGVAPLNLVLMTVAFVASEHVGVALGTLTIVYNLVAIAMLAVIVAALATRRLPPRVAPLVLTLIWVVPVGATLVSQHHNGEPHMIAIVVLELMCLVVLVDTRFAIGAAAITLGLYLPLVIRDADAPGTYAAVVAAAAVFGIVFHVVILRSLVAAEQQRLASAATAAELARRIEELERSEAERLRLHERVLHVQRLEAVSTLAGGIAHDMNNVLAAIATHANLIAADDPSTATTLQQLVDETMRGAVLTRNLLAFGRRGRYRKTRMSLAQLLDEVVAAVEPSLPAGCRIVRTPAETVELEGDPVQLRQVFVNLCQNAAEAMTGGGTVVLAVDRAVIDVATASPLGIAAGEYLRVHVVDTGGGMSEETRRHLFEPFYSAKPAGKGKGLGLAVVWGVVHAHGGTVLVDSEPGRGSQFSVMLPVPPPRQRERVTPPMRATNTVLVVDDEPAVRAGTRRLLERRGYEILVAGDGAEALRVFADNIDAIGLVVLDMGMPIMGGAECFEKLRELSNVPVLVTTGYADDGEVQSLVARGAGLVEKPFDARTLLAEVSRLVRRASTHDPARPDSASDITPT